MAQNKNAVLLLLNLFLFSAAALCAQEIGYFIDYTGDTPRIFQRFAWDKDEYAMQYEMEIQFFYVYKDGDEEWFPSGYYDYLTEKTTENIIEFDLPPGRYRLRVTPFDFLGRKSESSEWFEFEIMTAHIPIIESFSPKSFFLDKDHERVLTVIVLNVTKESEIYLRNTGRGGHNLYPVSTEFYRNNRVKLFFDENNIPYGEYEIYVKNPKGGIETTARGFKIEYSKAMDVFLKAAYTPVAPVYGEMKDLFNEAMYAAGLSFGLEFINSKHGFFNGGFELLVSAYYLSNAFSFKGDIHDLIKGFSDIGSGVFAADIDLNITLQKYFLNRRMAVMLRFGFGYSGIIGLGTSQEAVSAAHFNIGLFYMFLLSEILYLEIGANFTHYNTEKFFGIIRPRLSFAWKI
ncbi:MAG: hypothetical protein FWB73_03600 [Treponema sp.]|nr:hypothetical protein [Treponema sp.]